MTFCPVHSVCMSKLTTTVPKNEVAKRFSRQFQVVLYLLKYLTVRSPPKSILCSTLFDLARKNAVCLIGSHTQMIISIAR